MNVDILEEKWKQIRGQAKEWWGKLTDDDLDRVKEPAAGSLAQFKPGNEVMSSLSIRRAAHRRVHPPGG